MIVIVNIQQCKFPAEAYKLSTRWNHLISGRERVAVGCSLANTTEVNCKAKFVETEICAHAENIIV